MRINRIIFVMFFLASVHDVKSLDIKSFFREGLGAFTNQKNVKIVLLKNVLSCVAECMKRSKCRFFAYKKKVCGVDRTGGRVPLKKPKNNCVEKRQMVDLYPRTIAGACSDHTCTDKQICKLRKRGGYHCRKVGR